MVQSITIPKPSLGAALLGQEEEELLLEVLRSKALFRYYGPDPDSPPQMVARLEREIARMAETPYALAVTSGTAALETALGALGVGPGDEVIVPAWSWNSCFTAIVRVGAKPVLAEIDTSFTIPASEVARLASPRTKAVLVVHYQGAAADMEGILREAEPRGIAVLEDCAESPGARYRGRRVGSIGKIGIFSFQHNKMITSGEGGAVVTHDPVLYERAVRMHDLGNYRPFHSSIAPPSQPSFAGSQFRMSELTAAVALAQLRKLDAMRAHVFGLKKILDQTLSSLPGLELRHLPDADGELGFELYFFLKDAAATEVFKGKLFTRGIPCQQMTGTYCQYRREYCLSGQAHAEQASPFREEEIWPAHGYRPEDFPVTEDLIQRFIALPLGVNYTRSHVESIAAALVGIHGEVMGTRA